MNIRNVFILAGVSAAIAGSATVALAGANSAPALDGALESQLSSFGAASVAIVPPSVQQQLTRSAGGTGLLDDVAWAQAVAAPVAGSALTAWVVPARDKVCLIAPDPVDGYGVGCSNAAEVAAGEALLLLAAPSGAQYPSISVALTPDGSPRPTTTDAAGTKTPLARTANISATVVPPGGTVATYGKKWDLAVIQSGLERASR